MFFSTRKQVKFIAKIFQKLKIQRKILGLEGSQKQWKRTKIYESFGEEEKAVMFTTDLMSRGIDFPDVDWVFQFDSPFDFDSYIHR